MRLSGCLAGNVKAAAGGAEPGCLSLVACGLPALHTCLAGRRSLAFEDAIPPPLAARIHVLGRDLAQRLVSDHLNKVLCRLIARVLPTPNLVRVLVPQVFGRDLVEGVQCLADCQPRRRGKPQSSIRLALVESSRAINSRLNSGQQRLNRQMRHPGGRHVAVTAALPEVPRSRHSVLCHLVVPIELGLSGLNQLGPDLRCLHGGDGTAVCMQADVDDRAWLNRRVAHGNPLADVPDAFTQNDRRGLQGVYGQGDQCHASGLAGAPCAP